MLTRDRLFALNYLLLLVNAMATFVGEAVALRGAAGALLSLFDISAIVWLAIIACLALLWNSGSAAVIVRRDWVYTAIMACIAIVPFPALSAVFLVAAGLWGYFSSAMGSPARRAAVILISLSAFFFWGRLFLALGAGPMLAADYSFYPGSRGCQCLAILSRRLMARPL